MRRLNFSLPLLLAALAAGCERWEPIEYGPGPGGGLPPRTDQGGGDGGTTDEGPADGEECPEDPDGVGPGGGLVLSEVAPGADGFLEFYNRGPQRVEEGSVTLEGSLGSVEVDLLGLDPGRWAYLPLKDLPPSGELVLHVDGLPTDYLCWGFPPSSSWQNHATARGLWHSPGACALSPGTGQSLHLRGSGVFAGDYRILPRSPLGCAE